MSLPLVRASVRFRTISQNWLDLVQCVSSISNEDEHVFRIIFESGENFDDQAFYDFIRCVSVHTNKRDQGIRFRVMDGAILNLYPASVKKVVWNESGTVTTVNLFEPILHFQWMCALARQGLLQIFKGRKLRLGKKKFG